MQIQIALSCPLADTPRAAQIRGMFDLADSSHETLRWTSELPIEQRPWNVGLIVGPSGSGKSTIAKSLWPQALEAEPDPPRAPACVDDFPESLPVKQVVELLSSVGFSSPPAWLRPYNVLSTGQRFRVDLARSIAFTLARNEEQSNKKQQAKAIVFDEYTSVVDRTVAQIASSALARTIRKHQLQFVAVTCHEDVEAWLQPDWVFQTEAMQFRWRELCKRPSVDLTIVRCAHEAWSLFAPHHYLSGDLNKSAVCYLALWKDKPVAFTAWLTHVAAGAPKRREHRTVCLPDYQGVGMGNALANTIASMWKALSIRPISTTTHPGMIAYRRRSPLWSLTRPPSFTQPETTRNVKCANHATTRLTAGFEYIGPAMPLFLARSLYAKS